MKRIKIYKIKSRRKNDQAEWNIFNEAHRNF